MRHGRTAALPLAATLWLAGCGGTPDTPERDLDVAVESDIVVDCLDRIRAVSCPGDGLR